MNEVPPEVREAIAFLDDSLAMTLEIIQDIAESSADPKDREASAALDDIRTAHTNACAVLQQAGLLEPAAEPPPAQETPETPA